MCYPEPSQIAPRPLLCPSAWRQAVPQVLTGRGHHSLWRRVTTTTLPVGSLADPPHRSAAQRPVARRRSAEVGRRITPSP
ncbi:hypothetical protein HAX54_038699 [Datura stramonium]|uniref:Uncharacterized protein n=1 Tax=Datura stramonium TaxID=4076 RepID=A0ABS8RMV1_DATST|nr:hypothetical protein [Datura stramonium]